MKRNDEKKRNVRIKGEREGDTQMGGIVRRRVCRNRDVGNKNGSSEGRRDV